MGWQDYHLHMFLPVDDGDDDGRWEIGIPIDDEPVGSGETIASWQVPVTKHFQQVGDRMTYVYDFGDDWIHDVVLADIISCDSERPVVCVGGERACPPEDCGGPWGYQTMLEALADPGHDQHDEIKRWIGGSFDSEKFDPTKVKFDDPQDRWNRAFKNA